MTALCGGGTSSAKTGYATEVYFSVAAIAEFLANKVDRQLASFLAPFLAAVVVPLTSFCSTDPPSAPTLSASDLADLLPTAPVPDQLAAISKVTDWFKATYWCEACQCDNGTIPSCTTGSTPTSPPQQDAGLPSSGPPGACWTATPAKTITVTGAGGTPDAFQSANFLPTTLGSTTISIGGGFTATGYALPAGTTRVSGQGFMDSVASADFDMELHFYNASLTEVFPGQVILNKAVGQTGSYVAFDAATPATAVWATVLAGTSTSGSHSFTYHANFSFMCGAGNAIQTVCCTPDPSIELRLNQIYALLETVYSLIPVRVPNYAAGTVHSGLSGNGNISLDSTTIAVKVEITQLPDVYGQVDGSPQTYLEVGWVSPANNEGVESGVRLSRSTQVIPLPEATSSLDYSLPPGETVDVSELQAG